MSVGPCDAMLNGWMRSFCPAPMFNNGLSRSWGFKPLERAVAMINGLRQRLADGALKIWSLSLTTLPGAMTSGYWMNARMCDWNDLCYPIVIIMMHPSPWRFRGSQHLLCAKNVHIFHTFVVIFWETACSWWIWAWNILVITEILFISVFLSQS